MDKSRSSIPAYKANNKATLSSKSTGPAPGTACDQCHRCKVRCSGRYPVCDRCLRNVTACTYSLGKPLGKPKGRKNSIYGPRNQASRTTSSDTVKTVRSRAVSCLSSGSDGDDGRRAANSPPATASHPELAGLQPSDFYSGHHFMDETQAYSPSRYPLDVSILDEDLVDYFAHCQDLSRLQFMHPPELWDNDLSQTDSGRASSLWSSQIMPIASIKRHIPQSEMEGVLPLGLITKLHYQQKSISWRSINSTLCGAKQGIDAVSNFLSCSLQTGWPASAASSQLIACFLMLQQALGCYMELWMQACNRFEQGGAIAQQQAAEILSISGFPAESTTENCKHVLENFVRGEMTRGQTILIRLREVADELKSVGDDKTGLLQMLFPARMV